MRRSAVFRYGGAVLVVAVAALLERALWPWVQPSLSPLFTAAVMLAALFGGLGPGLLATALGVVACAFLFLPPTYSLAMGGDDALRLVVFMVVAVTVSSVAAARRRAELSLAAAREAAERANLAKDRFFAVVSHELRSPLSPVLMAASAMEHDPSLPEAARQDAAMIRRNAELEGRLVDDLLDTSRIQSGKLELRREEVDLHDVLDDCLAMSRADASAREVRLTLKAAAGRAVVSADPVRLRQAFSNLIRNAVKFTPAGGTVAVRTGERPDGRVRVEVADTGVGIDPAVLPRVFEPFEQGGAGNTRRFGGLGLGLTIARGVVAAHGGTIRAHSDGPDRGATFTVELPVPVPDADGAGAGAGGMV